MHLLETYGDLNIPPLPKDLIPLVDVDSSLDEITPLAPIAPTDLVPTIDEVTLDIMYFGKGGIVGSPYSFQRAIHIS